METKSPFSGTTFYAVCFESRNGVISVCLEGGTAEEARASFKALDTRKAVDDARKDIEDDLYIDSTDRTEEEFVENLEGADLVGDLTEGFRLYSVANIYLYCLETPKPPTY